MYIYKYIYLYFHSSIYLFIFYIFILVQSNGVRVCASYSKRNIYSSVLLEMFVTSCRGGQGPPSPQIAICAHASNMSDMSVKNTCISGWYLSPRVPQLLQYCSVQFVYREEPRLYVMEQNVWREKGMKDRQGHRCDFTTTMTARGLKVCRSWPKLWASCLVHLFIKKDCISQCLQDERQFYCTYKKKALNRDWLLKEQ